MTLLSLLRFVGAVLGVIAAISLARTGLGIRYHEDFLPYLEAAEGIARVIVWPIEWLIVVPVVRWLHEQGLSFQLYDHWRNVFLLLCLFNVSYSQVFAPTPRVRLDKGIGVDIQPITFIIWFVAIIVALAGSTLAGLVALGHDALFWWPVVAFFSFVAFRAFIAAAFQNPLHARPGRIALAFALAFLLPALDYVALPTGAGHAAPLWWAIAAYFTYAAALVPRFRISAERRDLLLMAALAVVMIAIGAAIGLGLGILTTPDWLSIDKTPSPGLACLAAFVAILGLVDLFSAAFWGLHGDGEFVAQWFESPKAQSALRILSTLGVAAIVVYFARV